jgi:lactate dehydrogenase-like 2-hydroxyacid dehydrogenase
MPLPQSIVYAEAHDDGYDWWAVVYASDHNTQLVSRGPYPDESTAQHAAVMIAEKLAAHVQGLEFRLKENRKEQSNG